MTLSFRGLCVAIGFVASAGAAHAAPMRAATAASCNQTAGEARARRIVSHCLAVTAATHPPCNAQNDCDTILEFTEQMCRNIGAQTPAFCTEGPQLSKLADGQLVEHYAATAAAEQAYAAKVREKLRALRITIEPLAAKRSSAAAALKTGQAELAKELKLARAAYDEYKAASNKPGAVGLDAARQALTAQFSAAESRGQTLAQDAARTDAIDSQLATLIGGDQEGPWFSVALAAKDSKDAKTVIDALNVQLAKAAAKQQGEALAKDKAATKDKTPLAAKEAAAAKTRSAAAADALARAKALGAQAALAAKAVQALASEVEKETLALRKLAGATPDARAARAQTAKAVLKTAHDQQQAKMLHDELTRLDRAAADRRRPNAPSATGSGCNLERVDLRNFDYPDPLSSSSERFRNGNQVVEGSEAPDESLLQIHEVQFVDLNSDGKKEAVVFMEGPPSAHSGPQNELRFMELDDQCRVQQLAWFNGGVYLGAMKGKSYFYGDTLMGTPPGSVGNFAIGTEQVELRYINGELKELSRRPDTN